jgi:hypothetical protein
MLCAQDQSLIARLRCLAGYQAAQRGTPLLRLALAYGRGVQL